MFRLISLGLAILLFVVSCGGSSGGSSRQIVVVTGIEGGQCVTRTVTFLDRPGASGQIVGSFDGCAESEVEVIETQTVDGDKWYKVKSAGGTSAGKSGWVAEKFVKFRGG